MTLRCRSSARSRWANGSRFSVQMAVGTKSRSGRPSCRGTDDRSTGRRRTSPRCLRCWSRPTMCSIKNPRETIMLTKGDLAPDFTLTDQHGASLTLSGLRGRKVLVYFYPKADTPGCTAQSCGLRDIAGDIGDTAIVGVSPDTPQDQLSFDE